MTNYLQADEDREVFAEAKTITTELLNVAKSILKRQPIEDVLPEMTGVEIVKALSHDPLRVRSVSQCKKSLALVGILSTNAMKASSEA